MEKTPLIEKLAYKLLKGHVSQHPYLTHISNPPTFRARYLAVLEAWSAVPGFVDVTVDQRHHLQEDPNTGDMLPTDKTFFTVIVRQDPKEDPSRSCPGFTFVIPGHLVYVQYATDACVRPDSKSTVQWYLTTESVLPPQAHASLHDVPVGPARSAKSFAVEVEGYNTLYTDDEGVHAWLITLSVDLKTLNQALVK